MMVECGAFDLSFSPSHPSYARFPFIFEGRRIEALSCVLSSRSAGSMVYSGGAPGEARIGFYRALGLESGRVFTLTQVHDREVIAVDRESRRDRPPADGMVSRDRDLWLQVSVADCLPVYLYDTESGAFGLVHSGWRGTGIVLRALALMGSLWNTRAEAVAAVLGPCIGPCCYRVDGERARAFEAEFGGGAYPLGPVSRVREGNYFLDLKAANARLLAGAGVRHLAYARDCTCTDERLGSFRREGPGYTRMAAMIGYPAPP
jgi:YfiH family protein